MGGCLYLNEKVLGGRLHIGNGLEGGDLRYEAPPAASLALVGMPLPERLLVQPLQQLALLHLLLFPATLAHLLGDEAARTTSNRMYMAYRLCTRTSPERVLP